MTDKIAIGQILTTPFTPRLVRDEADRQRYIEEVPPEVDLEELEREIRDLLALRKECIAHNAKVWEERRRRARAIPNYGEPSSVTALLVGVASPNPLLAEDARRLLDQWIG